jgi:imidazolonepropionase
MMSKQAILIGPFDQVVTMSDLPKKGPLKDEQLEIISNAGILIENGKISSTGIYSDLQPKADEFIKLEGHHVALPGIIDAHTHICFGGNRARDFALRNAGSSYLEIAAAGGGIWDSVTQTRLQSKQALKEGIKLRANKMIANGITTIEVKSGYGLSVAEELKMLEAINAANTELTCQLIPTCLAAHIIPREYKDNPADYVKVIVEELFPILKARNLTNRVDAFLEKEAYDDNLIKPYFDAAKELGFDITVHADQFTPGGSELAVSYGAVSADHLEASTQKEIDILAKSDTVPMA